MPASLEHLVRLVANFFDSFTAALFVRSHQGNDDLHLMAWESLSPYIVPGCNIEIGQGLIGWVAREGKRLHATHFDRDTRTLGIYSRDVGIKAFLAAPLLDGEGVLMVDSKNRYSFPEKKQRILEDCAIIATDLWFSWKNHRELQFFRRWNKWHHGLSGKIEHMLISLKKLLGLKSGLVAFQEIDKNVFIIKATIGLPQKISLEGQRFSVEKGLVGWLLRYRKHLTLVSRHEADKHRSYFLWPGEPFDRGPVLIGLFQPTEAGALVWILTGDTDLSDWPGDLAELLVFSLDRVINDYTVINP
ncbi:MAG: GAF domain-containing protein [Deltaproteobacteria bacterium]|nr:GAF domain-containing protein [Deltaproteobacteria bacterium]MBW2080422.1 GAF domain-containing protein [Deltaproteobacteria bacterium]MBW2349651.1 GAF domain-containing protein [Deltaproteobacteria bacterium]